jgi:hypothetical protein
MTAITSAMKIAVLATAALLAGGGATWYGAGAQAAKPVGFRLAPGHSVEVIAPAVTVVSTVHYQAELQLTCTGVDRTASCSGDFPKVRAKHRLNITRMSCFYDASIGSTFSNAGIDLIDSTGALVLEEITPLGFSSSEGAHSLNSAVDLQIEAGQHMSVGVVLAVGTPNFAFCTTTGILSTLG